MTYTPEQDLNHHSPKDPAHRYACHNKPDTRFTVSHMPNGFDHGVMRYKVVRTDWLDVKCGHSYRSTDPGCTDCKWR